MLVVMRLFAKTRSGVVLRCSPMNVGKCGPRCCSVPSLMRDTRALPTGLDEV